MPWLLPGLDGVPANTALALRLARILSVRVEDLFALPVEPEPEEVYDLRSPTPDAVELAVVIQVAGQRFPDVAEIFVEPVPRTDQAIRARVLERYGCPLIGANVEAIQLGENREEFKGVVERCGAESARCVFVAF